MTISHSAFEHNFRRFALCYCVFVYKMYVFFRADVCYNKNAEREREKNPERQILKKDGTTMNINIIGKQVTIRDDMKALAEKKLAKFDRYFPEGADAVVTVRREEKTSCVWRRPSQSEALSSARRRAHRNSKTPLRDAWSLSRDRFARTRQDLRKE